VHVPVVLGVKVKTVSKVAKVLPDEPAGQFVQAVNGETDDWPAGHTEQAAAPEAE